MRSRGPKVVRRLAANSGATEALRLGARLIRFFTKPLRNLSLKKFCCYEVTCISSQILRKMARLTYPEPQAKGLNVLKQFAHTPATAKHWGSIGAAQFKDLELSNKNRELSILLSTSKFRSSYEFSHHVPVSTKEGVTDAQREVLIQAGKQKGFLAGQESSEKLKDLFTQKERALLVFLEAVIESPEVDDKVFAGAKAELSDREIVELITLQVRLHCRSLKDNN